MNANPNHTIIRVITILLGTVFILAGLAKLSGMMEDQFTAWAHPVELMYTVGVLEILGAIGLFRPKLRIWASLGLIGLMFAAIYTHQNDHIPLDEDRLMIGLNLFLIVLLITQLLMRTGQKA